MRKLVFIGLFMVIFTLPITAQSLENIDEIGPFSEGLAAVRKGNQWGFINEAGEMVIGYRDDIYWNKSPDTSRTDVVGMHYPKFNEGLCLITKSVEDGIPVFGFIDTKGDIVIEPQFLNIYPFKNGSTTGVLIDKTIKGENEFKLEIYEYKFFDVMVNSSGEITDYFERRNNILMTKRRYTTPDIGAKLLTDGLVAVQIAQKGWQIKKIN